VFGKVPVAPKAHVEHVVRDLDEEACLQLMRTDERAIRLPGSQVHDTAVVVDVVGGVVVEPKAAGGKIAESVDSRRQDDRDGADAVAAAAHLVKTWPPVVEVADDADGAGGLVGGQGEGDAGFAAEQLCAPEHVRPFRGFMEAGNEVSFPVGAVVR
jgi:hypothetical protein